MSFILYCQCKCGAPDERRGVMSWFSGVSPGVSPGLSPEPGLARQESTLSKDCDTTLKETESEGDMLDNLHFDSPVLRHRPDSSRWLRRM